MAQLIVSLEVGGKKHERCLRIMLSDVESFRSATRTKLLYSVFVDSTDSNNLVKCVVALDNVAQLMPVNPESVKHLVTLLGPLAQLYRVNVDKLMMEEDED